MAIEHIEERIQKLIGEMTLDEKISQLTHESAAVERLGIPAYNWWNECLHGVARAGAATVFPQAIALAATFDDAFVRQVADAISDEARAKYNEAVKSGNRAKYRGLTFWSPNINIFRDPRWGRGQETYGEDPCLTGRIGAAFVRGLQGDDPQCLKTAACAKHFAVHSGPEHLRHTFNATCSSKDLAETYLPAFKMLVDAGVEAVMGAYNRLYGEPCCASTLLLKDILRGSWKFQGHVVSDCWAIRDFHETHKVTPSPEKSAALALNTGCDLNCGCTYPVLDLAVKTGLVSEDTVNTSLARLLRTRFKLGMFDPPEATPYAHLSRKDVRSEAHIALARKAAEKSVVLLKNAGNLLPLSPDKKRILLIGPGAADIHAISGNYHGLSPHFVTILEGLSRKIDTREDLNMDYQMGCCMYDFNRSNGWTLGMADTADVVVAVFGLDIAMEGEEGESVASEVKGDRTKIELPQWQLQYLRALRDRKKPIVLVLTGGSPIAIPEDIADAVLFAWYSGEQGGNAVADILFGDVVPSGKLPVTFPRSTKQLPPYEDYSMKNRTYRFMTEDPLFPFGFGLSYTAFAFSNAALSAATLCGETPVVFSVDVANTGACDGEEVVQVYVSKCDREENDPRCSLKDFRRVALKAGESKRVSFTLDSRAFYSVTESGAEVLLPGAYTVIAADAAPVPCAVRCGAAAPVSAMVTVLAQDGAWNDDVPENRAI